MCRTLGARPTQTATELHSVTATMEPELPQRKVYNGSRVSSGYIATAVQFTPFDQNHTLKSTRVNSLEEYSAGCREHAGCFGHMCVTPQGNYLPPQSLSVKTGPIVTEYLKAAALAFGTDSSEYKKALKRTNYTKNGHMRNIMSTPIAGSLRLVATPQISLPGNCVCIPKELADATRFCAYDYDTDGKPTGFMVERTLREGDYAVLVRAPSLTWLCTQPMIVRFWDRPTIGVKPETFSAFHGDYDGDEAHLYPVSSPASLWEARNWITPKMDKFVKGRALMDKLGLTSDTLKPDDHSHFVEYTTLSSKQLMSNEVHLTFGDLTRNPDVYVDGMSSRFKDPSTELNFVAESIRGTADILRQQLTQSSIGEMSRNAKIATSCVFRSPAGDVCIQSGVSPGVLEVGAGPDSGCPANRATMLLCSKAQQSALDAHRVGSSASTGFDFVGDLFCPNRAGEEDDTYTTLCVLDPSHETTFSSAVRWKVRVDGFDICLLTRAQILQAPPESIVGGYSPLVLARVEQERRQPVCKQALMIVLDFYRCEYTDLEVSDLAYCMSYEPEASVMPITSRDGLVSRHVGWVEQLMSTDYSRLPYLRSFKESPTTSTCAMYLSNFTNLVSRRD